MPQGQPVLTGKHVWPRAEGMLSDAQITSVLDIRRQNSRSGFPPFTYNLFGLAQLLAGTGLISRRTKHFRSSRIPHVSAIPVVHLPEASRFTDIGVYCFPVSAFS